jgi:hypothetical protein
LYSRFQELQKFDGDFIDIWIEEDREVRIQRLMRAIYTFVAVDEEDSRVPQIIQKRN